MFFFPESFQNLIADLFSFSFFIFFVLGEEGQGVHALTAGALRGQLGQVTGPGVSPGGSLGGKLRDTEHTRGL